MEHMVGGGREEIKVVTRQQSVGQIAHKDTKYNSQIMNEDSETKPEGGGQRGLIETLAEQALAHR